MAYIALVRSNVRGADLGDCSTSPQRISDELALKIREAKAPSLQSAGGLPWRLEAWQSFGTQVDLRVVDMPCLFLFDPHERDIERQPRTLIDGGGARGYSSC